MKTYLMLALLSGCVDVPGPISGQEYLCTVLDAGTQEPLYQVTKCGPWDDWYPAAEAVADEYPSDGRAVQIDCRGTQKACDFDFSETE